MAVFPSFFLLCCSLRCCFGFIIRIFIVRSFVIHLCSVFVCFCFMQLFVTLSCYLCLDLFRRVICVSLLDSVCFLPSLFFSCLFSVCLCVFRQFVISSCSFFLSFVLSFVLSFCLLIAPSLFRVCFLCLTNLISMSHFHSP